jgi:hypothetical protein
MAQRLPLRLPLCLTERRPGCLPARSAVLLALVCAAAPATAAAAPFAQPALLAQAESFMVGPGSSVGPATKVKPKNCVTNPDGSITCDTQLENSPSDTQARPQFELFKN